MGYTHYFNATGKPLDKVLPILQEIADDHKTLIAEECDLDTPANITPKLIAFNGKGEDGHETFWFVPEKNRAMFCKTAHKPYDVVVCKMLLVLFANDIATVRSDGFSARWENQDWGDSFIPNEWVDAVTWYNERFHNSKLDIVVSNVRNPYMDVELKKL